MSEILPRHYIIGIIIFTLVMVSGITILSEFNKSDSTFVDSDKFEQFNRSFNTLEDITSEVGNIQSNIENTDTSWGDFGVVNSLILSAWNTISLLMSSFSFMNSAFAGLYTVFGIPSWIGSLIILLVIVVLAFAIYSAIFQKDI